MAMDRGSSAEKIGSKVPAVVSQKLCHKQVVLSGIGIIIYPLYGCMIQYVHRLSSHEQ